ncbi:Nif3-like dinuclear metal center hexameric protein [Streptococcus pneumoniae]
MLASDVIKRYEAFCPQELSMEGDSVGLQIGTLNKDIKKVMLALDVREQTVQEAIEKQVDLLIVKHAPIFRPIKHLCADSPQNQIYMDLIKHDIAVYVSHTNIDVVKGGLNDWFCELLEVEVEDVLREIAPNEGIGRVGRISPQSFGRFAQKVKEVFGLDSLRMISYGNDEEKMIERVAICGGSGDSFFRDAVKKQADVYITGDIYYHTAQDMLSEGLLALDPGHYIEVLFVSRLAALFEEWKKEEKWDVDILASQASTNPFSHL